MDKSIIYNVYGRPDKDLTAEKWNEIFELMKDEVKSGRATVSNTSAKYANALYENTNNGQYAAFLNSVEREVRLHHIDYLYFGYQIWDMLFRFKKQLDKHQPHNQTAQTGNPVNLSMKQQIHNTHTQGHHHDQPCR